MRSTKASGRTSICAAAEIPSKPEPARSSATSSAISCSACPRVTKESSMQFGLSESQQILKNNARKFFAAECPMADVRRVMEIETAYDAKLWMKMAEQGFLGVVYPENAGGVGFGFPGTAGVGGGNGHGLVAGARRCAP